MLTNVISQDLEILIDTEKTNDYKKTLEQIKVIKENLKLLEQATKEMAVDDGLAYFKQVTIKEHIRKEHEQTRFYWNKPKDTSKGTGWQWKVYNNK